MKRKRVCYHNAMLFIRFGNFIHVPSELDLSRTLKEQGVTGDTCIVFRAKKQNILKNRLKKKVFASYSILVSFLMHLAAFYFYC